MIANPLCRALLIGAVLGLASLTTTSRVEAQSSIVLGAPVPAGPEAEDLAVLDAAVDAFNSGGYPALQRHTDRLRTALDRAPESYGTIESRSATEWIVRSENQQDAIMLSAVASAVANQDNADAAVTINAQPNVYPTIALLLGSEAVERGALEEALGYVDRGLALQPAHAELAAEKMAALHGMNRMAEALAVGDAALAAGGNLPLSAGQGILQRRRAFSLIELGRLAEAREALAVSLEHDPDSETARLELQYIETLERGGRPVAGQAIVPNGN